MTNPSNHQIEAASPGRLLITTGPTHEPIDAVRYIGNRSSGTLGVALADAAARRGGTVTLLLGPTHLEPTNPTVRVLRFQTTADLEALLAAEWPAHDTLIMSAAVADYRPRAIASPHEKLRRSAGPLTLELESTPDLLAQCSGNRRPGQTLVGFALEPQARLADSARDKLARKGVDLIVANPLETMESPIISATLFYKDGTETPAPPGLPKSRFADWLLDRLADRVAAPAATPQRLPTA